MKRNTKKETLAKNIINTAHDLKDLNYLHKPMGEIYDKMTEDIEKRIAQKEKWGELYEEFQKDKKGFVKKYAKPDSPSVTKLIKKFLNQP